MTFGTKVTIVVSNLSALKTASASLMNLYSLWIIFPDFGRFNEEPPIILFDFTIKTIVHEY